VLTNLASSTVLALGFKFPVLTNLASSTVLASPFLFPVFAFYVRHVLHSNLFLGSGSFFGKNEA
jgi:hypothetical protein